MTDVLGTVRWQFQDTETNETWTMPINPNKMSSPEFARNLRYAYGLKRGLDRPRTMARPPSIVDLTWGGVIYTQEHHDKLAYWARKEVPVILTDHMGRSWEVVMKSFVPTDRRPKNSEQRSRFTYEMSALIMRQVTP